jgi:PknH-like extracellular domain
MVAPADLEKLLLSDAQISDIVGVKGLVTFDAYKGLTPPQGETFSHPSCAETLLNTMWTAYNGSGYTGGAGRRVRELGDRPVHDIDQGVVAFPSADAATLFVNRTVVDWERCADVHFTGTSPPPDSGSQNYTLGFPTTTGGIPTVVNTAEGGEGYVCAHAITSRSNVVIDVYVCGNGATADQAVAVVKSIANEIPR